MLRPSSWIKSMLGVISYKIMGLSESQTFDVKLRTEQEDSAKVTKSLLSWGRIVTSFVFGRIFGSYIFNNWWKLEVVTIFR